MIAIHQLQLFLHFFGDVEAPSSQHDVVFQAEPQELYPSDEYSLVIPEKVFSYYWYSAKMVGELLGRMNLSVA